MPERYRRSTAGTRCPARSCRCGVRFDDNPDRARVAAAKLVVVDEPVASWESALRRHAGRFGSGWGDGSYPVRVGRTAEGAVACFVADMLLLHDAEVSAV